MEIDKPSGNQNNTAYNEKSKPLQVWEKIPVPARLLITFFAVFLASIGYLRSSFFQGQDTTEKTNVELDQGRVENRGQPVDVAVQSLTGESVLLSKYRSKVTVVTFWASWCAPCVIELPSFGELYKQLHNEGLEIVAINLDDEREKADAFLREYWNREKMPFDTFFDPERKALGQFSVETIPSTYVLDKKGKIAFSVIGSQDWNNDKVLENFRDLLKEP